MNVPVRLSDVTLIAIDGVASELTRLALNDTLRQIEPYQTLVFSERPLLVDGDVTWVASDPRSFSDVARILWYEAPVLVKTSHYLTVQWDGWVLNGSAWDFRWLGVDYVGAPWDWYHDRYVVGNGGFSLRSTRLARWVARHPWRYPVRHPEDATLCRTHRPSLELEGFSWADRATAARFSTERTLDAGTFGFHGMFRWPDVLGQRDLAERTRLAIANDYVRGKPEFTELMDRVRRLPFTIPLT